MATNKRTRKAEEIRTTLRWLSPLPPLDWRWQAALAIADEPGSSNTWLDGPDITEAVEYLQALADCETDEERADVREEWPMITQALAVFKANGTQRWKVEARVLSGATNDEIAAHCDLTSDVVVAYAKLFFAVEDYLADPDWLYRKIFGLWPPTFCNDQLGRFWSWVALAGGAIELEKFIKAFHEVWRTDAPPTLIEYLRPSSGISLSVQALVAIQVLPQNDKTVESYFVTHLGLIEAEAEKDPLRKQEKLDQLKRRTVAFAFAFLSGKSARQLKRILHGPKKRKKRGEEQPSPPAPLDAVNMLKSMGGMGFSLVKR